MEMTKVKEVTIDENPDMPELPEPKLMKVWILGLVWLLVIGSWYLGG